MLEPFFLKEKYIRFTIFKVNLDLAFLIQSPYNVKFDDYTSTNYPSPIRFFLIKFDCLVPTENYIAESS